MRTFLLFSITALFLGTTASTAQVLINEIDYDQPGTDNAEFVELYNPGVASVDLTGWTLELVNGANQEAYQEIDLSSLTILAGGYAVICDAPLNVANCDIDVRPFPDFVNLIEDGIGPAVDPDAVGLKNGSGTLVDVMSYEGDVPLYFETAGTSAADNSVDEDVSLSRTPNGTDTNNNDSDFQLKCSTPGAANKNVVTDCGTLPIELGSFDYRIDGGDITLAWSTLSEVDVVGFEIENNATESFETVAFVGAVGNSTTTSFYSHTISDAVPGIHTYRLKILNSDGSSEYTREIEVDVELVDSYFLSDVYPNPFNPRASINLTVKQSQSIRVAAYNMLGRQVALLFNGTLDAGSVTEFTIDGSNLTSGIYLLKVEGEYFESIRSVVLFK